MLEEALAKEAPAGVLVPVVTLLLVVIFAHPDRAAAREGQLVALVVSQSVLALVVAGICFIQTHFWFRSLHPEQLVILLAIVLLLEPPQGRGPVAVVLVLLPQMETLP
jgi:hypothetical protein